MEDFSQIIGLLLAILFFVVGALRKKNKKDAKPTSAKANDIFSSLFDQEFPGQGNAFEEARDHFVEEEKQEHVFEEMVENVQPQVVNEKVNVSKIEVAKPKRKFNLRQAVIYSEILNRKYT